MMERFTLRTHWPLSRWQAHLAKIYSKQNEKREPLATFARLQEMCAGMARGVHRHDAELIGRFAPRALAWLLGLATRLNVDLEKAVWDCYPQVCPHCAQERDCVCKIKPSRPERLGKSEIEKLQTQHERPRDLMGWTAMFFRIYGPMNREIGEAKCLASFFEELGELSEIIRFSIAPDPKLARTEINQRLREELTDIFAWMCAMCSFRMVELDAEMKYIYDSGCPECHSPECNCDPYHVHEAIRLGKRETLH